MGWWGTILGIATDQPWQLSPVLNFMIKSMYQIPLPSGRFWMVSDHPWQLSPVLNFMIKSMCQIPSL